MTQSDDPGEPTSKQEFGSFSKEADTKKGDGSPDTDLDANFSHETALNAYRIDQLEKQLENLRGTTENLNFSQIKQMFAWIGIPVVIATSVFGVSLWQTIQSGTTSAAEQRASDTVRQLTNEINALQTRITVLQMRSQETFEDMRELRGRADESTRAIQNQADRAEGRANEAALALAQLQRTAASANEIQQALGDVERLAERIAENTGFQEIIANTALTNLAGLVAAFDQSEGCPEGWTEFTEAAGRMIIGVGQGSIDQIGDQDIPLTLRRWRDFGGGETHALKANEMPGHRHGIRGLGNIDGEGTNIRADSLSLVDGGYSRGVIETIGQGYTDVEGDPIADPHNNMPPYIALFFCEKDAG
ncbi:MAG: hypothetical protein AAGF53_12755 [Pseudomonadota bacterium]